MPAHTAQPTCAMVRPSLPDHECGRAGRDRTAQTGRGECTEQTSRPRAPSRQLDITASRQAAALRTRGEQVH